MGRSGWWICQTHKRGSWAINLARMFGWRFGPLTSKSARKLIEIPDCDSSIGRYRNERRCQLIETDCRRFQGNREFEVVLVVTDESTCVLTYFQDVNWMPGEESVALFHAEAFVIGAQNNAFFANPGFESSRRIPGNGGGDGDRVSPLPNDEVNLVVPEVKRPTMAGTALGDNDSGGGKFLKNRGNREGTIGNIGRGFPGELISRFQVKHLLRGGFGLLVFVPGTKGDDSTLLGPLLVLGGHFFDDIWMLFSEVIHLGAVRRNVIKFPIPIDSLGDELPVPIPDGTVSFMLEEDRLAAFESLAFENGNEGGSFHGDLVFRVGGLGEVETG